MQQKEVDEKPQATRLSDYRPPSFSIPELSLRFELGETETTVLSEMKVIRRKTGGKDPLQLNGEKITFVKASINGRTLTPQDYECNETHLTIHSVPDEATLCIETRIDPSSNHSGQGLYRSGNVYCTQMEAEGFRNVTYFLDRPDVLSRYTTTIVADKTQCPLLLSNGNKVEEGTLDGGRHYAVWKDPFPKPCYLFALVAGDLAKVASEYTTKSGRKVQLEIFVNHGNEGRCEHAMEALKNSMRWDEEAFGLEYDLDIYMIVAVDEFNMGAMENKGLNVFNSKYVLADTRSATDLDFSRVETVIAHEYFHNWTGNRVTCRDWFQLTLKEGLTVFRDQEFTSDRHSRPVKRIEDVRGLKSSQFSEDAGPNAHPIQPDTYIEIDNFYTATVYQKGSEVLRMIDTMVGRENFRRGVKAYLDEHDGGAVTTEDFIRSIEKACGIDLAHFRRWYHQSGTPIVKVNGTYDSSSKSYTLEVQQETRPTRDQQDKLPLHIPIVTSLIGKDGKELSLKLEGDTNESGEKVLHLKQSRQSFTFLDVPEKPVPSLLRGFSAPVKLETNLTEDDLIYLFNHDTDPFNRFEVGQKLSVDSIIRGFDAARGGKDVAIEKNLLGAFERLLSDPTLDPAFKGEVMSFPGLDIITAEMNPIEYDVAQDARESFLLTLGRAHSSLLKESYEECCRELKDVEALSPRAIGLRKLKNALLAILVRIGEGERAVSQYLNDQTMTERFGALASLCDTNSKDKKQLLEKFYQEWQRDTLVLDRWFAVQARIPSNETLQRMSKLETVPEFDRLNPNKLYSLFLMFTSNYTIFHSKSGEGYSYVADKVIAVNDYNPSVAARLAKGFAHFKRVDETRRSLMRKELERILAHPGLSPNVFEIVSNTIAEA